MMLKLFLGLIFITSSYAAVDVLSLTINLEEFQKCFPLPENKEMIFGDNPANEIKFYVDTKKNVINIKANWDGENFKSAETILSKPIEHKKITEKLTGNIEFCHFRQEKDTLFKISYERQKSETGFDDFLIVQLKSGSDVKSLTAPPPKFIYEGELIIKSPVKSQPLYSRIKHGSETYRVWVYPNGEGQKFYLEVLASPGYELNEIIQTGPFNWSEFSSFIGLWKELGNMFLAAAGGEEGLKTKLVNKNGDPYPHSMTLPGELEVNLTCWDRTLLKTCSMAIHPSVHMNETKRTKFTEPPHSP